MKRPIKKASDQLALKAQRISDRTNRIKTFKTNRKATAAWADAKRREAPKGWS